MNNVGISFEILDRDCHVPVVWKKFTAHMVLNVKMDLIRKARWVLDGHRKLDREVSLYDGDVSRESVRIVLMYRAFNEIYVVFLL